MISLQKTIEMRSIVHMGSNVKDKEENNYQHHKNKMK